MALFWKTSRNKKARQPIKAKRAECWFRIGLAISSASSAGLVRPRWELLLPSGSLYLNYAVKTFLSTQAVTSKLLLSLSL